MSKKISWDKYGNDAIAVIGVGCRMPKGISSKEALFDALLNKEDLITQVPSSRFDTLRFAHHDRSVKGHSVTFKAGVVGDVTLFDNAFFGMSVSEAASLDPQQRLALEMSYEAILNAGIKVSDLKHSNTAVVIGAASTDMAMHKADDLEAIGPYSMTGTNLSIISNRLSYFYDLHGPSLTVDTACSSSLVALHTACEYLRSGRVDLALTGGVNILLSPMPFIGFSQAHMLSPSGHCQVFCDGADGYVRSEGGAILVLKRLKDAIRDLDPIGAVIVASNVNSDGRTQGIALPNGEAQSALLESVYGKKETDVNNLVYVEAHGTGTKVGDPIECKAIGEAIAQKLNERKLNVGSIKANVGHLETASGMAGFIKALEILKTEKIPGQKLYGPLNANIDFNELNLKVNEEEVELPKTQGPALIGINSFGFGGTNAHVVIASAKKLNEKIIEEANLSLIASRIALEQEAKRKEAQERGQALAQVPTQAPSLQNESTEALSQDLASSNSLTQGAGAKKQDKALLQDVFSLTLSAKSQASLKALALEYAKRLTVSNFAAYSALTLLERDVEPYRLRFESLGKYALSAEAYDFLIKSLEDFGKNCEPLTYAGNFKAQVLVNAEKCQASLTTGLIEGQGQGKLALVFSGNGCQYQGMAVKLYQSEPLFKEAFDRVSEALLKEQELDLKALILDDLATWDLDRPEVSQIFIFAIEVALAKVLKAHGLKAQVFLGHSVGEIAAAFISGLLSLDEACKVIVKRSYYQAQTSNEGGMLAVRIPFDKLQALFAKTEFSEVEIAGYNAKQSFTLSGPKEALSKLLTKLKSLHCGAQLLKINYAFHSKFMESIKEGVLDSLASIKGQASKEGQTFISTVTGKVERGALDATYWWRNIREPVLFENSIKVALEQGVTDFVEVGPRGILTSYISDLIKESSAPCQVLSLLTKGHDSLEDLEEALLKLKLSQVPEKEHFAKFKGARALLKDKVSLPPYPFAKQKCWVASTAECQSLFKKVNKQLLGRPKALGKFEAIFDENLSLELYDHKVNGKTLMPFVGMLEIALELAKTQKLYVSHELLLLNFEVRKALSLTDGLVVVENSLDEHGELELKARAHLATPETLQTIARCRVLPCDLKAKFVDLEALRATLKLSLEPQAFYEHLALSGLEYGPRFRQISKINYADTSCLVEANLNPQILVEDNLLYPLGTLDAALQAVFVLILRDFALHEDTLPALYLPVGVKKVWFQGGFNDKHKILAYLENYKRDEQVLTFDVTICDMAGKVLCKFEEVSFKAVNTVEKAEFFVEQEFKLNQSLNSSLLDKEAISKTLEDFAKVHALEFKRAHFDLKASSNKSLEDPQHEAIDALKEALLCALIFEEIDTQVPLNVPLDLDEIFNEILDDEVRERIAFAFRILERNHYLERDDDLYILKAHDVLGMSAQSLALELLKQDKEHFKLYYPLISHGLKLKEKLENSFNDEALGLTLESSVNLILTIAKALSLQIKRQESLYGPFKLLMLGALSAKFIAPLKPLIKEGLVEITLVVADESEAQKLHNALQDLGLIRLEVIKFKDFVAEESESISQVEAFDGLIQAPLSKVDLNQVSFALKEKASALSFALRFDDFVALSLNKADLTEFSSIFKANVDWKLHSFLSSTIYDISLFTKLGDHEHSTQKSSVDNLQTKSVLQDLASSKARSLEDSVPNVGSEPLKTYRTSLNLKDALCNLQEFEVLDLSLGLNDPKFETLNFKTLEKHQTLVLIKALSLQDEDLAQASLNLSALLHKLAAFNLKLLLVVDEGSFGHALVVLSRTLAREFKLYSLITLALSPESAEERDFKLIVKHVTEALAENTLFANLKLNPTGFSALKLVKLKPHYVFESENKGQGLSQSLESTEKSSLGPWVREILVTQKAGRLSSLTWQHELITECLGGFDNVEIEVKATGLNFRDVMWGSGLLPYEALRSGFAGVGLGFECAGVITALDEGAKEYGLKVGDAVIALGSKAFASKIRTKAYAVFKLPHNLSFAQGAALSVVYFTAYWSLIEKARVKPGQKILIHGAAGGVGLAAINIARDLGLEIYATAGSESKRNFLKALGIKHVYNSRDFAFSAQILADTQGVGVDLVLNSLYDKQAALSLELVAPGGAFIELGKRDFYEDHPLYLKRFKDNIAYFGVDADEILALYPKRSREIMLEIAGKLENGSYEPIPITVFSKEDVVSAFMTMRKSLHIGKIVVLYDEDCALKGKERAISAEALQNAKPQGTSNLIPTNLLNGVTNSFNAQQSFCVTPLKVLNFNLAKALADPKRIFVISGATGGIGKALCEFLLKKGAKCLVALGRKRGALIEDPRVHFISVDLTEHNFAKAFKEQLNLLLKELKEKALASVEGEVAKISSASQEIINEGQRAPFKRTLCEELLIANSQVVAKAQALNKASISESNTDFEKELKLNTLKQSGDLDCTSQDPRFTFIHLAGITRDMQALELSESDYAKVIAVKALSAQQIIEVLDECGGLKSFLGISSVTTLLGNPGQSAYVTANALLESLVLNLRSQGLEAQALGLGPVGGVGMLEGKVKLIKGFERSLGIRALEVREVIKAIESLSLLKESPVVHYFASKEDKLNVSLKDDLRAKLLLLGQSKDEGLSSESLSQSLKALSFEQRQEKLVEILVLKLSALMGVGKESLDPKRKIASFGLDSLLVMEFASLLEELLGFKIPLTLLDTNATLENLAQGLNKILSGEAQESDDLENSTLEVLERQHGVKVKTDLLKN